MPDLFIHFRFLEDDVTVDVKYPTDIDRYSVHYQPVANIVTYFIDTPGHVDKIKPGINFMFARDPYTRIWSAYLDKFYLPDFWYYAPSVIKTVRKSVSQKSETCGHDVTFEEFLRYIYIQRADPKLNEHFTTVTFNCNPCKLQYDILGKVETFKNDTNLVLANAGLLGEIEEDPNLDRDSDEINMLTDYNFHIQDKLMAIHEMPEFCFDNVDISYKLWKVFQYNGYIGEDIPFPRNELSHLSSKEEFKSRLKEIIMGYRKSADKDTLRAWTSQRQRTIQSVYNSLPEDVLNNFQAFYSIDFELFQYDKNPSWLKHNVN